MDLFDLTKFDITVHHQPLLSEFTTFRLGGACPALLNCQTPQQLEKAIQFFISNNRKFILIGGGSNLVVSDEGIERYVIRYVSDQPLIERRGNDLNVSGSTSLDQLAHYAAENGLEGVNYTSGIPGTVGGAIAGNAGAFGRQIGDVVKSVNVICRERSRPFPTVKDLSPSDLRFSYRNSILKKSGDIVVSAKLALNSGDQSTLLNERDTILGLRHEKHPDLSTQPCAGSFFRNIEPTSKAAKRQAAGWFLDQAGAKKLESGGAKIFAKHANIIIKSEDCSAQDVFELSRQMARLVKDRFHLDLIREVRFVGMFDGMPNGVNDIIW